jgi:RsiW-degrading membrane proteinase PrsW (M82 family)
MADNWIKKVSFVLAVLILFVAVVQVGLGTFWPNPDYPQTPCLMQEGKADDACLAEDRAAREAHDEASKDVNAIKFIVGTVISLLAVLIVLFVKFNNNIVYGLFGGAVFNQLFTLGYARDENYIGFVALLILFVVVIFFIQRNSKK